MRKEGVQIGPLWEAPEKPDITIIEELQEQEAQGVLVGPSQRPHKVGGTRRESSWNPKELTPKMNHILDLQLFNPTITPAQLADAVDLSVSQVRAIIGSSMYRTKYNLRRVKIERLQNSRVASERVKFEKLRDEMIAAHRAIIDIDKKQHVGKELELEKLKQRSVTSLLNMSTDQLKEIDRKLSPRNGEGEGTVGAEVELDTSDPKKAYVRLLGTFRKGTK